MTKIPANNLIALFQRMYREHWPYIWGKAEEGCVDCSGAFVYAYRQHGLTISHGSNAIARRYVVKLLPVSEAKPGMAAFKLRKKGAASWALPESYWEGHGGYNGDLNDYYHIGLVDEGGQFVLNAQGTIAGFTRTKLNTWHRVGYLKAVDYDEKEMTPMQNMEVWSENGGTVRVREKPNGKEITALKPGTIVQAGEDQNGWREIVFGDEGGYMMSKFLREVADTPAAETPAAFVKTLTTEQFNHLCEMRDRMEKDLEYLKTIVGCG